MSDDPFSTEAVSPPRFEAINEHIGRRLRRRRKLFGWTLSQLANATGLQYQQIHKYECGICRVSAARLFTLACVLNVPIEYFFAGLAGLHATDRADKAELDTPEVRDLIHAYFALPEAARRKFIDLAKSFEPAAA